MKEAPVRGVAVAPCNPIDFRKLTSSLEGRAASFRVVRPVLMPEDPVLFGRFRRLRLSSGLSLHATDAVDVHDLTTEVETAPGLTVAVFLRGRADVSLGSHRLRVDAAAAPRLFLQSGAESDLFVRRGISGNWVRKTVVRVPPGWFEDEGGPAADAVVRRFVRTHGASAMLDPSLRQVDLAERIVGTTPFSAGMERFYLESHAFEIVAEALARIAAVGAGSAGVVTGRERARAQAVCEFLDAHEGDSPRLDEVARHAGMSVSALQRLFRAVHGTSVFGYYREVRMERARTLLVRDGVSVTEAAFAAGFGSPANFATAFRRRFGLSPKEVRGGRAVAGIIPASSSR